MPNLMPGAVWRPIPVSPSRPRRRKGRGVCLHVAVSEGASLFGYFSRAAADSHFYVTRAGVIEQYVDADLVAYANLAGNPSLLSVETQGGVTDADREPWTEAQLDALARIVRWAHESEGIPLQLMPDSRPESRGIGWHRLGVPGYVVAGGEQWSSARGKICPGAGKIAQVPEVIRRAAGGRTPAPAKPAPAPARTGRPPAFGRWTLPAGHYYGNLAGPAESHGGYYAAERPAIKLLQQWLVYRGVVAGVPASAWSTTSWCDGRYQAATDRAAVEWHRRFYPGQPHPAQLWRDDVARLTA